MRKIFTGLALTAVLAVPATAAAQAPTKADKTNAAKECKALLKAAGSKQNLASTLSLKVNKSASNAYGKCVSKLSREEAAERKAAKRAAAAECKALKGRAQGQCLAARAKEHKAASDDKDKTRTNSAKACRAEQKADGAKFTADYGTAKNAFGKCVSRKSEAKNDQEPTTQS